MSYKSRDMWVLRVYKWVTRNESQDITRVTRHYKTQVLTRHNQYKTLQEYKTQSPWHYTTSNNKSVILQTFLIFSILVSSDTTPLQTTSPWSFTFLSSTNAPAMKMNKTILNKIDLNININTILRTRAENIILRQAFILKL